MIRASGGPDTPQRNWNNIPDLLRAMRVKVVIGNDLTATIVAVYSHVNVNTLSMATARGP